MYFESRDFFEYFLFVGPRCVLLGKENVWLVVALFYETEFSKVGLFSRTKEG